MIIKKCDVCKSETDALYDKEIATHTDTINRNLIIKQEKLHICRTCMKSVTLAELQAQLGWYEDNVKDGTQGDENTSDDGSNSNVDNESNENNEQNGEGAGGTTIGD